MRQILLYDDCVCADESQTSSQVKSIGKVAQRSRLVKLNFKTFFDVDAFCHAFVKSHLADHKLTFRGDSNPIETQPITLQSLGREYNQKKNVDQEISNLIADMSFITRLTGMKSFQPEEGESLKFRKLFTEYLLWGDQKTTTLEISLYDENAPGGKSDHQGSLPGAFEQSPTT